MATAREFDVSAGDASAAGAAYDQLEVPGDYEAQLQSVEDYDKTGSGGSHGWVWTFVVEGLPFKEWTSFSTGARWKLLELVEAMGHDVEEGLLEVNPNSFVGSTIGVSLDWDPPDASWDGTAPRYRRIAKFFRLVELEDTPAPL